MNNEELKEQVDDALQYLLDAEEYCHCHTPEAILLLRGVSEDLAALSSYGEPIARGWALPPHRYLMDAHLEDGERTAWFDRRIHVCLDRVPRGSRPVIILPAEEGT